MWFPACAPCAHVQLFTVCLAAIRIIAFNNLLIHINLTFLVFIVSRSLLPAVAAVAIITAAVALSPPWFYWKDGSDRTNETIPKCNNNEIQSHICCISARPPYVRCDLDPSISPSVTWSLCSPSSSRSEGARAVNKSDAKKIATVTTTCGFTSNTRTLADALARRPQACEPNVPSVKWTSIEHSVNAFA